MALPLHRGDGTDEQPTTRRTSRETLLRSILPG
jgi:hypothetical protein